MATKRPTYSSWSVNSRLVGLATVTCGGAGGPFAARGCTGSQPASTKASGTSAAVTPNRLSDFVMNMRFSWRDWRVRRSNMGSLQRCSRRAREDVKARDCLEPAAQPRWRQSDEAARQPGGRPRAPPCDRTVTPRSGSSAASKGISEGEGRQKQAALTLTLQPARARVLPELGNPFGLLEDDAGIVLRVGAGRLALVHDARI